MKSIGRFVQKQLLPGILGLSLTIGSIGIPCRDTGTAKAADVGKAAQEGDTVYNVTDFGANGSDKKDDRDAIDTALFHGKDADGHITVIIPAGTYYISKAVRIFSNTTLIADPNATIISTDSDPEGAMVAARHLYKDGTICLGDKDCTHGKHTQIQNITIQGGTWNRNDAKGKGYNCIFRLYHGKNITLKDMTMQECSYHYVNISGVDGALIENVTFKNQAVYTGTDKRFWKNYKPGDKERYGSMETIHLDNTDDSGYPLDKTPCSNVTIKGCTFQNVYAGLGTHHPATGTKPKNFTVQGCTFKNVKANCINSYSFQNITISKNTADNCRDFVYAHASKGVADKNKISNAKRVAFNINNQSNYTLKSNNITEAATPIRSQKSTVSISSNTLKNASSNMIYITGGTATITNNTLDTSQADGIRACNNAVLNAKKNTIKKTKFGFGLKDLGKGNVLQSNTITSTKECGIYIMSVKKCNILKNTVKNVKGHALFGAGTAKRKTSLNITGNTLKTSSSSKRDIYLGKYNVNCRIKNNTWTKRGYTHDPSVKASVSGNKRTK